MNCGTVNIVLFKNYTLFLDSLVYKQELVNFFLELSLTYIYPNNHGKLNKTLLYSLRFQDTFSKQHTLINVLKPIICRKKDIV